MNRRTIITAIVKLYPGDLVRVNKDKIYLIREFDAIFIESLPYFDMKSGKTYDWSNLTKEVDNITVKSFTEK